MSAITIAYNNRPITEIFNEFIMLRILPTLHSMAVTIASVSAGQWTLHQLDYILSITNETVSWTAKSKENVRSVSWLIFLPLLVTVQYIRVFTSLSLFIVWGKTLSNEELNGFIESSRKQLQEIMIEGQNTREAAVKDEGTLEHLQKMALVLFHSFISVWPMRLAIIQAEKVICFLGRIKEITCQSLRPSASKPSDKNANTNSEQPESENPEHETHENEQNEHHHHEHHQ